MPNLMTHLKKVSEQKPQATYYNVDMLKYQVGCSVRLNSAKSMGGAVGGLMCRRWGFHSAEEVGRAVLGLSVRHSIGGPAQTFYVNMRCCLL